MMDQSFTPEMITPQWVAILLVAGLIIFFGPRHWLLPTVLVTTAFVPLTNRTYVFGFNFFTARILLLMGWARVFFRREYRGFQLVPLDKAFIAFSLCTMATETLRRGIPGLVYGGANYLYEALGIYFLVRCLVRDANVIPQLIKVLGVICCILAVFMLAELLTHYNWLSPLGTFAESVQVREGRLRCQATFVHPVLAGTYGAVLLPIFAACWWQPRMKKLALAGCMAGMVMILTAGSGGPLMTFAAVIVGLFLWPLRTRMRPIRWGVLLTLVALHLVMNAPVWALMARLQIIPGASSFHRYIVIDAFVTHISEWWLVGVQNTSHWGWLTDDVANNFCVVAKHGGLLGLILFVRVLTVGFREVGRCRAEAVGDRPTEILLWAFGVSLFAHVVSFWGTSYFDQTIVLWYFTLAIVASLRLLVPSENKDAELAADLHAPEAVELEQALPAR